MRKVTLEIEYRHLWLMKGVYKISIGGKFYIGSANNLKKRMYDHQVHINVALATYPDIPPYCNQYRSWSQYILENEGICACRVQSIQRCVDDKALYYAEQRLIDEYISHADCLNKSPGVPRPECFRGGDNDYWDICTGHGGELFYYNPLHPAIKLNALTPLTQKGKMCMKGN